MVLSESCEAGWLSEGASTASSYSMAKDCSGTCSAGGFGDMSRNWLCVSAGLLRDGHSPKCW